MNNTKFPHKVDIPASRYTSRKNFRDHEGGALNAGYTPVDALCSISNLLGRHGLLYNVDYWWDGFSSACVNYDKDYFVKVQFAKEEHKLLLNLGAGTEHMLT